MIEILGSKVSFFTLYGLASLQVIAILCAIWGVKMRGQKDGVGLPTAAPVWFAAVITELIMVAWMGSL